MATRQEILAYIAANPNDYSSYSAEQNIPTAQNYNIPGVGAVQYDSSNQQLFKLDANNPAGQYTELMGENLVPVQKSIADNQNWFDKLSTAAAPYIMAAGKGAILGPLGGAVGGSLGLGQGLLANAVGGGLVNSGIAAVQGDNIGRAALTGAVGGAAAGAVRPYLNSVINDIAGLAPDATEAAFMQIDANRLVDAGITGQQLTDTLTQAYGSAGTDAIALVAKTAIDGSVDNTPTIPTNTSLAQGTNTNPSGNTVTVTGQLPAGGNIAGNVAGGLLTGGASLPSNQQVVVTGQAPTTASDPLSTGLVQAANGLLTNNGTQLPANQVMEITGNRANPVTPSLTELTAAQKAALVAGAGGLLSNVVTGPPAPTGTLAPGGTPTVPPLSVIPPLASLLTGGVSTLLANQQAAALRETFDTQANKIAAANTAAQPGYQFSPIGITTRFGNATPKFDASGKLIGYDYGATGDIANQRDQLLNLSQQALPTTTNTADVQANYIRQQQGLLAPGQQQDLAALQAQMAATGRAGLATGATTGAGGSNALLATNPQLAAYYNSLAQQNSQLAANAPTYAQDLLNRQIGTSGTLFDQARGLESAAQQPMQLGTQLGTSITAGTTNASNAAQLAAQQAAQLQASGALGSQAMNTAAQQSLLSGLSSNTGFQNILSSGFNWLTGKMNP